ncbi:T9SS type A sorting domain-containing protein [Lewinella sp. JB7]|uniref:T9SS type A sorting domain-containing protein n=1 Tax=Lewinella sp. JB7 TaxID=2962887 RepID=UPI0020C93D86|nr:T9SS type A sorting domain-containing protein [Lewinella sp. JB7]MCP9234381.1 T9SS type A sorting domain-containing protein [Lewinella sp. JB7]
MHYRMFMLALCLALGSPSFVSAQYFPECAELNDGFDGSDDIHRFCVSQGTSDYYIYFSYQNISPAGAVCDCEENQREIIVARNSFRSGNNYFRFSPSSSVVTGSYNYAFGPDNSGDFYPRAVYAGKSKRITCLTSGTCYEETRNDNSGSLGAISGSTEAIREPTSFAATDGTHSDKIVLTWTRETDIPNHLHSYRIYRNDTLLTTVAGSASSYTDSNIGANVTYKYAVTTYTSSWGGHESRQVKDQGSAYLPFLNASDGTRYNSVRLEWANMSNVADEIRLEREHTNRQGAKVREELAVLGNNATGYNDQDAIPGFAYTYHLVPIGGTASPLSDPGYSRPDGVIKGYVRSKLGAGVSGVDVTVTLTETIPAGAAPYPSNCATTSYCATTDIDGYYEIRDIYYHEEATFRITPEKRGDSVVHVFNPALVERTIDVNAKTLNGVDFTDETVFTVAGKVHFPAYMGLGPECGMAEVAILIDSADFGIRTDGRGEWKFSIQNEGTYSFTPVFLHHTFIPSGAVTDPTSVRVEGDVVGIDFENTTTDSLQIVVQGSCNTTLGTETKVRVTSEDPLCYNVEYDVPESGVMTIYNLPARAYKVRVSAVASTNVFDQIGNKPLTVDLTVRDTAELITENETTTITPAILDTLSNDSIIVVQPADTVFAGSFDTLRAEVEPAARFIYRAPLVLSTDFVAAGAEVPACTPGPGVPELIMEQGFSYPITIEIRENVSVDCYLDTGFVKIYDFISDRGGEAIRLPIRNGRVQYTIEPGIPNLATNGGDRDYQKLLYIIPEVDFAESQPVEYWALVEGIKTNTPTFVSRSPDIPMLILHDPPGDNSYAYVEQGTTFESFTTVETEVGGAAGGFVNLLLGAKFKTPFSGHGFGTIIKFSAEAGRDNFNRSGIRTSMTFTETFSTSSMENLTGNDGDVYIGAAFNQEYSLSEEVSFNPDSCRAEVDIVPAMADNTFATTFMYTEQHIRNVLIPTFGLLRAELLEEIDTTNLAQVTRVNNLRADSLSWENMLAQNDTARGENAVFQENISFSAGATYAEDWEEGSGSSVSYEYNRFVNTEFALGAKIDNEGGIWFDSELGFMGRFRWSTTNNSGTEADTTRKVGYVLEDNDIGDFFSVDILRDTSYDVPAFDLKVGTSSCPQEPNTQARDRPQIQILPPERDDVPTDGVASFNCLITNFSESRETREYHVRTVSTTNPDGAVLFLGGHRINNSPASFFLDYGETMTLELAVERGPRASNYRDIGLMVYPPCEYELWQDNGVLRNADTAYIKLLNYETECTNVSLRHPFNNWVVNGASPDFMKMTFSGYDLNNVNFESITLEVQREGEGYLEVANVPKSALEGANYDFNVDLSNYPDGLYRFRAVANCGQDGVTYSTEKQGIIDRRSLAPFGYPQPSDGFLRPGGEISVTFDKPINCAFPAVDYNPVFRITRADTEEEIPVTVSCSGDKIILQTNPPLAQRPDLSGVVLHARVDSLMDLNGNVQKYATDWSFRVNSRPVFWDPLPITYTGYAGETHIVEGVLKNNSLLSKPFTLDLQDSSGVVHYPDWLRARRTNGTLLPNADDVIRFDLDPELDPGIYTDSIVALVDGEAVATPVRVELLAHPVNWPFDPTAYPYSMTVVATFSLDETDNLLSTDERDLVGAFVNGEIRGVTNIEYVPSINQYRAFLTVYSHDVGGNNGEEITFRFWHALNGVEYGAIETLTFVSETSAGSPDAPLILHPEGIFQVIPLHVGWNWISLNVQTTDMTREHLLSSIVGAQTANDVVIKSQSKMSSHEAGKSWNGNLKTLQLGEGYLLHLSAHPDTLKVVGLPSPTPLDVSVAKNWNWIGYPQLLPRPVNGVLDGLTTTVGDQLKGQRIFSIFNGPAAGWVGNLNHFAPGSSYKLHVAKSGTISYPAPKGVDETVDPGLFEHNMSIVGTFDLAEIGEQAYDDLDVIAYIDGEVRGRGKLEACPSVDGYRTFLLVHGNAADFDREITFRILNTERETDYAATGEPLPFYPDLLIGSIDEPYPYMGLSTSVPSALPPGYALLGAAPNPTTGLTTITYRVPRPESVVLRITDLTGRPVGPEVRTEATAGLNRQSVDLTHLPKGIYVYHLESAGFSAARRVVVQ